MITFLMLSCKVKFDIQYEPSIKQTSHQSGDGPMWSRFADFNPTTLRGAGSESWKLRGCAS